MSVDSHLPVWDSVLQDSLSIFSRTCLKSSKLGYLDPKEPCPLVQLFPHLAFSRPHFWEPRWSPFSVSCPPRAGSCPQRFQSSSVCALMKLIHSLAPQGKIFWGKRPSVHEQLAFATLRTRSELTRVTEPPTGSASVDG